MPTVDEMIERDRGSWEQRLRESAQSAGVQYDDSDLQGVIRHVSYNANAGQDPDKFLREAEARYQQRAAPTSSRQYDSQGPAYNQGTNLPVPGYSGGTPTGVPPPSSLTFNDPLTKQYEQLLQAQLSLYQQQQQAMAQAAQQAEQRRMATGEASKRLEGFINERVAKLQAPAYTGSEGEVLRTQFLDPLERDRSASHKRALERVSARGMLPTSGLAEELAQLVDREYNQYRAQGQGAIATRQIQEERSREQEAQQLLQYLAMLPDATARGDLDFVAMVQNLVAQPGQQGIAIGDILAELPSRRLNDALATLGIAPNLGSTSNTAIQLLQQLQQQRYLNQQNTANYWGNIGASFRP